MTEDYKQGYREGFQDGVESERRRQEAEKVSLPPRLMRCKVCGYLSHDGNIGCTLKECPAQSDYYEYR